MLQPVFRRIEAAPQYTRNILKFQESEEDLKEGLSLRKQDRWDADIQISCEYRDLMEDWKEYHKSESPNVMAFSLSIVSRALSRLLRNISDGGMNPHVAFITSVWLCQPLLSEFSFLLKQSTCH